MIANPNPHRPYALTHISHDMSGNGDAVLPVILSRRSAAKDLKLRRLRSFAVYAASKKLPVFMRATALRRQLLGRLHRPLIRLRHLLPPKRPGGEGSRWGSAAQSNTIVPTGCTDSTETLLPSAEGRRCRRRMRGLPVGRNATVSFATTLFLRLSRGAARSPWLRMTEVVVRNAG